MFTVNTKSEVNLLYKKGIESMQGTLFSEEYRDPIRVLQVSMDFLYPGYWSGFPTWTLFFQLCFFLIL